MPTNTQMERCISSERGALVFWSPEMQQRKPGSKVQIIDVFSLQVVTGYTRDPQGRLLLESQPSVAAGRSWSLAKAAQLIRNDARPHRWVALQLDKRAYQPRLDRPSPATSAAGPATCAPRLPRASSRPGIQR